MLAGPQPLFPGKQMPPLPGSAATLDRADLALSQIHWRQVPHFPSSLVAPPVRSWVRAATHRMPRALPPVPFGPQDVCHHWPVRRLTLLAFRPPPPTVHLGIEPPSPAIDVALRPAPRNPPRT